MKLLLPTLFLIIPALAQLPEPTNTRVTPDRPCGFKIAPCPTGSTCSASKPACPATRGENCLGRCVLATTVTRPRPSNPTRASSPKPTTTKHKGGGDDDNRGPRSPVRSRTPRPGTRTRMSPTMPTPTPTRTRSYDNCGGFRPTPKSCASGQVCIDDPYAGGCGMACDMPGICVEPTFCGGFSSVKCAEGKICVDDNRDDCDPQNGGRDCGGICV